MSSLAISSARFLPNFPSAKKLSSEKENTLHEYLSITSFISATTLSADFTRYSFPPEKFLNKYPSQKLHFP